MGGARLGEGAGGKGMAAAELCNSSQPCYLPNQPPRANFGWVFLGSMFEPNEASIFLDADRAQLAVARFKSCAELGFLKLRGSRSPRGASES